ncbi:MAG: DNA internalization-related competence protein ComEC/Rec2 [Alcanivoracaceae bacterium]
MPPVMLATLLGHSIIAVLTLIGWFGFVGRARWRRSVLWLVSGLLAIWYTELQLQAALAARLPLTLQGIELSLVGEVVGLPERQRLGRGDGAIERVRFQFRGASADPRWPGRKQLSLIWHTDEATPVRPGQQLQLTVRLRPVYAQLNEGGFDIERHALSRGLHARGSVLSLEWLADAGGLDQFRDQQSEQLRSRLAASPLAAALLPALVTGDRRGLDAGHWALLQRTGTAHLFAISGLHISLVAGLIWWLMRWLLAGLMSAGSGRQAAQRLAVLPALMAALGYAALAGFSLPTVRALVMTTVVMLLSLLAQRWPVSRLLCVAALAVVLPSPLALLDTSFWLSFGAVSLLALLMSCAVSGLLRLQLALSLVFGVLTALLFSVWSPAALPANLLLVPLFSLLLVPLALLGTLLPMMPQLLVLAAWLMEWSWQWLIWLAAVPALPVPVSLLAALCLALWLLLWLTPSLPAPRWALAVLVLPWLWPDHHRPEPGHAELVAFDVGQGQMVAVRTRNHLLLYDLGPGWHGGESASQVLLPWLARQRRQPDLTFVSHAHLDHAGGLAAFAGGVPGMLVAGESERIPGSIPCLRHQRWWFDEVSVEVIWPPPQLPLRHSNNRSCVVRIEARNQTVLLTGDIGRDVEHWLVEHERLKADLLQAPHHGSQTSSSFAFLRAVDPTEAFASAGYGNRFGHPAVAIQQRYREQGIVLRVTGHSGMLVFGRRGHPEPLRWRQRQAFPWRHPEPVVE